MHAYSSDLEFIRSPKNGASLCSFYIFSICKISKYFLEFLEVGSIASGNNKIWSHCCFTIEDVAPFCLILPIRIGDDNISAWRLVFTLPCFYYGFIIVYIYGLEKMKNGRIDDLDRVQVVETENHKRSTVYGEWVSIIDMKKIRWTSRTIEIWQNHIYESCQVIGTFFVRFLSNLIVLDVQRGLLHVNDRQPLYIQSTSCEDIRIIRYDS